MQQLIRCLTVVVISGVAAISWAGPAEDLAQCKRRVSVLTTDYQTCAASKLTATKQLQNCSTSLTKAKNDATNAQAQFATCQSALETTNGVVASITGQLSTCQADLTALKNTPVPICEQPAAPLTTPTQPECPAASAETTPVPACPACEACPAASEPVAGADAPSTSYAPNVLLPNLQFTFSKAGTIDGKAIQKAGEYQYMDYLSLGLDATDSGTGSILINGSITTHLKYPSSGCQDNIQEQLKKVMITRLVVQPSKPYPTAVEIREVDYSSFAPAMSPLGTAQFISSKLFFPLLDMLQEALGEYGTVTLKSKELKPLDKPGNVEVSVGFELQPKEGVTLQQVKDFLVHDNSSDVTQRLAFYLQYMCGKI